MSDTLTEAFILRIEDVDKQEICNAYNRRTEFKVLRTTYRLFDNVKPTEKTEKLIPEVEKPADEAGKKAPEAKKPAEEAAKPAEETEKPKEEAEKPKEEKE